MSDDNVKNGSIFQKMKDKARGMQTEIADKISQASEAGSSMLRETGEELNEIVPLLRELGYAAESIQIGIGLIPDISIEISGLTKKMDENAYQRVLEEKKDKKLVCSLLKALQTQSVLQDKIHIVGMKSDSAVITLTIPPKMNLKFKKI